MNTKKVRLAIFPFHNKSDNAFEVNIPAVLKTELSRYEFIEIVPVEVFREETYAVNPSTLWTGKDGLVKEGGILWNIEPAIIETLPKNVSARFSMNGDVRTFGDTRRIDIYIREGNRAEPKKYFSVSGLREEITFRLSELSKEIADWIRRENIVTEAEEDIRAYMGGLYTHAAALEKIKNHVALFPESIPLRALLLDLYRKNRDGHGEEIIREGMEIIKRYDNSQAEDTRYLLSLSLDPFAETAEVHEKERDWENAISIRNKALQVFPYKADSHKRGLGIDHYYLALSLEKKGLKKRALENYKVALTYLEPLSEHFRQAREGFDRLNE